MNIVSKVKRRPKRTRRDPSVAIGTWPTPERPREIDRPVRKRNGRLERFDKNKIIAGVMEAGATRKEARQAANRISRRTSNTWVCTYVRGKPQVASPTISSEVVSSLRQVNRGAANKFVRYRDSKLRKARRARAIDRSRRPSVAIDTVPLPEKPRRPLRTRARRTTTRRRSTRPR